MRPKQERRDHADEPRATLERGDATKPFIVKVFIPVAGYTPINDTTKLENPNYFGVERGFWRTALRQDEPGNQRPDGIDVTIELRAANLQEAEDVALAAARSLGVLLAAYVGSPVLTPHLSRLAAIETSGGICEERYYIYSDPIASSTRVKIDPYDLGRLINTVPVLDQDEARERVGLALRWYAAAIATEDPIDKYLSIWIGLEALGPLLNKQLHPNGSQAPCTVCKHAAGGTRDRGEAGILHLLSAFSPEFLSEAPLTRLKQYRNRIVHGLHGDGSGDIKTLGHDVSRLNVDLIPCLHRAVAVVTTPPDAKFGLGSVTRVSDVQTLPDVMICLNADRELTDCDPWSGIWGLESAHNKISGSGFDASGIYEMFEETSVKYGQNIVDSVSRELKPRISIHGVRIYRDGLSFRTADGDIETEVWSWRPVLVPHAWLRRLKRPD